MTNPRDLDAGYFQIANQVAEDLAGAGLSGPEYQIILFILRRTWGECEKELDGEIRRDTDGRPIKKQWVQISARRIAEATRLSHRTVLRRVQRLSQKGILLMREGAGRKPAGYRYQKHADLWVVDTLDDPQGALVEPLDDPQQPIVDTLDDPQEVVEPLDDPQAPVVDTLSDPQGAVVEPLDDPQGAPEPCGTPCRPTNSGFVEPHGYPPINKDLNKGVTVDPREGQMEPATIEELMTRYTAEQRKGIEAYWKTIRQTRSAGKLAANIVRVCMDRWASYPPEIVLEGMRLHIAQHGAKREEYTNGIIRRLARERKQGVKPSANGQPGLDRAKFTYQG